MTPVIYVVISTLASTFLGNCCFTLGFLSQPRMHFGNGHSLHSGFTAYCEPPHVYYLHPMSTIFI